MTASVWGQLWVVHAHPNRGAGRRLYGLKLSFTPGRPQKVTQQSLESERR